MADIDGFPRNLQIYVTIYGIDNYWWLLIVIDLKKCKTVEIVKQSDWPYVL